MGSASGAGGPPLPPKLQPLGIKLEDPHPGDPLCPKSDLAFRKQPRFHPWLCHRPQEASLLGFEPLLSWKANKEVYSDFMGPGCCQVETQCSLKDPKQKQLF